MVFFLLLNLSDLILVGYPVASTYQGGGGGKCEAKVGLIGVFFYFSVTNVFLIFFPDNMASKRQFDNSTFNDLRFSPVGVGGSCSFKLPIRLAQLVQVWYSAAFS